MRDLAAGVDAGVGAAGHGQPGRLGQPQRRARARPPGSAGPSAAPAGSPTRRSPCRRRRGPAAGVRRDEPAVPGWGGGLVVACVGHGRQPASSALSSAASSASARWRRPRRRPRSASGLGRRPRRQRPRPAPRRPRPRPARRWRPASASAARPTSSRARSRRRRLVDRGRRPAAVAAAFFAARLLGRRLLGRRLVAASASPTAACWTVSASTSSITAIGRVVALARTDLGDAGVAALAGGVPRPDLGEELVHDGLVADDAEHLAPRVQVATLGLGDQALGHRAQPLGLGLGRGDPAVLEQRRGQVGQHQPLVRGTAAQARALGGRGHRVSLLRVPLCGSGRRAVRQCARRPQGQSCSSSA